VGDHHQPSGEQQPPGDSRHHLFRSHERIIVVLINCRVRVSRQAIMMSICLQSMVDELMVKKSGGSLKKVGEHADVWTVEKLKETYRKSSNSGLYSIKGRREF